MQKKKENNPKETLLVQRFIPFKQDGFPTGLSVSLLVPGILTGWISENKRRRNDLARSSFLGSDGRGRGREFAQDRQPFPPFTLDGR